MKKKGLKLIIGVGASLILLPLAACSIEFGTSDAVTKTSNVDTVTVIPGDTYDDTNTITEDTTDVEETSTEVNLISNLVSDYETLYGYQMLQTDKYGSYLTSVYETLYSDAYNFLISTNDYETYTSDGYEYVVISEYKFTNSRYLDLIASAWITMIEENPIYYFTYTGYKINTYGHGKDKYYTFCFLAGGDYAKASDRSDYNLAILNMVDEFSLEYENSNIESDYDKAKFIHDYISNKVSYAYDDSGDASMEFWAHNILGVALNKGSVCESYAETYLFLSYRIDLEALIVLGYSGTTGHAWNYVCVDGIWYGVDTTWDDAEQTLSYNYFLVSNNIMSYSHTPNTNTTYGIDYQVLLPTLSNTSYDTKLDEEFLNTIGNTLNPYHEIPRFPGTRRR